jgi:hypothetical protein
LLLPVPNRAGTDVARRAGCRLCFLRSPLSTCQSQAWPSVRYGHAAG